MKQVILTMILALFLAPSTFASVRVFNSSGTQIGTYSDLKISTGLNVSQVSGKASVVLTDYGFNRTQTAVSGDLTASDCGKTITADDSELYNLPAISSSTLGCRFTFIHGVSNSRTRRLTVNPQDADKILDLTNAAGDSVTQDTIGKSLVLEAIAPGWAPVQVYGTWTDSN